MFEVSKLRLSRSEQLIWESEKKHSESLSKGPNGGLTRSEVVDLFAFLGVDLPCDYLFLGNLPVGSRKVGPNLPSYRRRSHGLGRLACSFLVSLLPLISPHYRGGTKHVWTSKIRAAGRLFGGDSA